MSGAESTWTSAWPELEQLLDALPSDVLARRDDATTLVLHPRAGAHPFDVALRVPEGATLDQAIAVEIEGWVEVATHEDDPDAEPDDHLHLALDLVAAALFGRLRIRRAERSGKIVGRDFVFESKRGPILHRRERAGWWWPGTRAVELVNAIAPPRAVALGPAGLLPWAPWAGTIVRAAATAAPRELPTNGELDLHPFSPREVKPLVLEYIEACQRAGITELRIVHGKGIGALRRTVHAILEKHPDVASFRLGGHGEGSWGATMVTLRRP